jgi:high-affinity K+ transport system ATPase subunit B
MAKKKTSPSGGGITSKELAMRARYPIGMLFQVSTLAACIAYLVFTIRGTSDMAGVLYRSVIVFLGCSILFGIVMVAIVTVLHKVTITEIEESINKARLESIEQKNRQEKEESARQPQQLESGDSTTVFENNNT